jgi:sterol desaturase/sphingolipid hydroxylase (fatty acid hydroxylase superfamily)
MGIGSLTGLVDWWGFLVAAIIFLPIERFIPLHGLQRVFRKGWTTDILYVVVNGIFVRFGLLLLLAGLLMVGKWLVPSAVHAAIGRQAWWLQCIEAIVIGDFCLYWTHRALHENRHLWRFHSIHHAIEELDWVAAYHAHPIDELMLNGAAIGSVFMLGFSPAAIALYVTIFGWVSLAVHANTRITIGPLRWLCASPEFHHWHHSNEREARDHNFASVLSLWDVAFGTAFLPRGRVPKIYGIDQDMPRTYADQLLHPFRRPPRAPVAAVQPAE